MNLRRTKNSIHVLLYKTYITIMSTQRAVTVLPRALRAATATRCLTTTVARLNESKIAENEVPVVTYVDGSNQPEHTVIRVDQSKPVDNISTMADVAKKAFALEKEVALKLSPTLKKFMLDGKVALVTGYVPCVMRPSSSQKFLPGVVCLLSVTLPVGCLLGTCLGF